MLLGKGDVNTCLEISLGGNIDELREYLSLHPDMVNATEPVQGNSPIHIAARKNFPGMMELLVRNGANVDAQVNHVNIVEIR